MVGFRFSERPSLQGINRRLVEEDTSVLLATALCVHPMNQILMYATTWLNLGDKDPNTKGHTLHGSVYMERCDYTVLFSGHVLFEITEKLALQVVLACHPGADSGTFVLKVFSEVWR